MLDGAVSRVKSSEEGSWIGVRKEGLKVRNMATHDPNVASIPSHTHAWHERGQ